MEDGYKLDQLGRFCISMFTPCFFYEAPRSIYVSNAVLATLANKTHNCLIALLYTIALKMNEIQQSLLASSRDTCFQNSKLF